MKLQIVQFNWNRGGGSATIHLEGPAPESALNPPQYFAVHVGFHTRRTSDLQHHPDQESILLPGQSDRWLVVGFFWTQPVNIPWDCIHPDTQSYRRQVSDLLANMVANAELENLDARVPTVICT